MSQACSIVQACFAGRLLLFWRIDQAQGSSLVHPPFLWFGLFVPMFWLIYIRYVINCRQHVRMPCILQGPCVDVALQGYQAVANGPPAFMVIQYVRSVSREDGEVYKSYIQLKSFDVV